MISLAQVHFDVHDRDFRKNLRFGQRLHDDFNCRLAGFPRIVDSVEFAKMRLEHGAADNTCGKTMSIFQQLVGLCQQVGEVVHDNGAFNVDWKFVIQSALQRTQVRQHVFQLVVQVDFFFAAFGFQGVFAAASFLLSLYFFCSSAFD